MQGRGRSVITSPQLVVFLLALDQVAEARNSGDGTVGNGLIDALTDAAQPVIALARAAHCEICGHDDPVRYIRSPRGTVVRVVCVDMARCMARFDSDGPPDQATAQ